MINQVKISGYGTALPQATVYFEEQRRYRITGDETQLSLAVESVEKALKKAEMTMSDIDCIVAASAVAIQPIPSTAALIHEQVAMGLDIPAIDVNTTCTSFVTALDMFSYLIEAGRYRHVLIVSSEVGSLGLNPDQQESFELFSDGAAAMILSKSDNPEQGMLYSVQKTWSEGAHATEIRGGLTNLIPSHYSEETHDEYLFDMNGREILSLVVKKLPAMVDEFYREANLPLEKIDMIVPHQASRALHLIMKRLGVKESQYINLVKEYGNMVSASIPFSLCWALDQGKIKPGDTICLLGTAAGLTTNIMAFKM